MIPEELLLLLSIGVTPDHYRHPLGNLDPTQNPTRNCQAVGPWGEGDGMSLNKHGRVVWGCILACLVAALSSNGPAYADCVSQKFGNTTYYNCDGKFGMRGSPTGCPRIAAPVPVPGCGERKRAHSEGDRSRFRVVAVRPAGARPGSCIRSGDSRKFGMLNERAGGHLHAQVSLCECKSPVVLARATRTPDRVAIVESG